MVLSLRQQMCWHRPLSSCDAERVLEFERLPDKRHFFGDNVDH